MKFLLPILMLVFAGCTVARNRNATFQTLGGVKALVVQADGTITAQEVGSPLDGFLGLATQGMVGKALGVLR